MVFVPPQRIHFMICDNDETAKTVIGISKRLICDEDTEEESILLPFETDMIDDHCFFKDNGEIAPIIERLNSAEDTYIGRILVQSEILKIYAYIYNEWMKEGLSFIDKVSDSTVFNVVHILENEYMSAPSAYEMAQRLNISYSNMAKTISAKLGTSYNSLLNSIRMENAKKMLLSTDKNITEIGLDCGFCDSSYFIKLFRKNVGVTPSKYRTYSNGDNFT